MTWRRWLLTSELPSRLIKKSNLKKKLLVVEKGVNTCESLTTSSFVFRSQKTKWEALWNRRGLFFIHLTHESEISHHKGMNSGWMNLGWNFYYLFLSIKKDDIQCVFFTRQKMEISSHYRMNLKVFFSYVYRRVNFWPRMDEFEGVFFICLWGVNFWPKIDEFKDMFFIRLQGCEFLTENGWIWRCVFHMFVGCEFLTENGWI